MKKKRYIKVCSSPNTWIEASFDKPREQVIMEFKEKYGALDNQFYRAISKLDLFNQKTKI